MHTRRTTLFFVMPAALVVLAIVAYPLLSAIWLSMTDAAIGSTGQFIGLGNYTSLIGSDIFRHTIGNTLIYTFLGLVFKVLLGFALAIALNRIARGRTLVAGLLLLPWIIPTVISTLVWRWMFDSSNGVLNYLLLSLHIIRSPVPWLGTGPLAMASVVAVAVWREIPYFGVSFLAGLKNIPRDQYEAAATEGANAWQQFLYVTLPNLRGIVLLVSVLSAVQSAYDFTVVWVLTAGGPVNATHIISTLSFETAFMDGSLGKAVAVSLVALPVLAPIILMIARAIERQEALA